METDKELFEKALGYYTCNADEIVDDVIKNDDWSEAVLWDPFEDLEANDIGELVYNLYTDFINIKNNKK